ncbi:MAG TPA: DinB family protein [Candidatus Dormibacteraeota bacterium]|nr:DinB family protein [Candidatus Dormibacteraeota bacterium]
MIDFSPVRTHEKTLQQLADELGLGKDDLARLAAEMCDTMLELVAEAEDPDVTFVPEDPEAHDRFAATSEEVNLPWTLGHVIVHATASAEESAALALTLARGVPVRERSRYEVPWQEVTTAEAMRHRLRESRRMQLAMLDAWPDRPHLEVTYRYREGAPPVNAVGRFLMGLAHSDSHLEQIRNVLAQARAARGAARSG